MGSADNRLRKKWQDYSGRNASEAENDFYNVFKFIFEDSEFGFNCFFCSINSQMIL